MLLSSEQCVSCCSELTRWTYWNVFGTLWICVTVKVCMLKLCCYNKTVCIFLALLLAYMKGNGNLCRTLVKAGACLGAMNKDGVTIFNYQVATKQLLSRYNNLYAQILSVCVLRPLSRVLSSVYGNSLTLWNVSIVQIEIQCVSF